MGEMSETYLNKEEKKRLLEIARRSINEYVAQGSVPSFTVTEENLKGKQGAFVTINKKGQLRGCIGNFVSEKSLHQTVQDMAIAAATQDPRFPPLSRKELKDIELEISVLSPLREIKDTNGIKVGKHGIYLTRGIYRGVLLPQVATEYGWDRETFLERTCLKAGLPADAWKEGDVKTEIFSAQVFGEKEI